VQVVALAAAEVAEVGAQDKTLAQVHLVKETLAVLVQMVTLAEVAVALELRVVIHLHLTLVALVAQGYLQLLLELL
jgi:hypothetical protein